MISTTLVPGDCEKIGRGNPVFSRKPTHPRISWTSVWTLLINYWQNTKPGESESTADQHLPGEEEITPGAAPMQDPLAIPARQRHSLMVAARTMVACLQGRELLKVKPTTVEWSLLKFSYVLKKVYN